MRSKKKALAGIHPLSKTWTSQLGQRFLRLGEIASPQSRLFNIKLHLVESDEYFLLPECHRDLTIRNLKSRLELFVGIPVNFQRIQYLDKADLSDESTLRRNDVVPGGTLTMRIWSEDSWGRLVIAATSGKIGRLKYSGATKSISFCTANSGLMKEETKKQWIQHRAFVALFITAHRGHTKAVEFLLQNGADLTYKTPLGRTALHAAVTSGQLECINILLNYGARITDKDNEGHNTIQLARLWKQKESERRLFRHLWVLRARRPSKRQTIKTMLDDKTKT